MRSLRVGLATGCFDGLHKGHRYFLEACRTQCDWLIVAVNTDDWCRLYKGIGRPINRLRTRLAQVSYLADAAIPFNGKDEALAWSINPDVVFRGWDQSVTPSVFPIIRIARGPDVSTSSRANKGAKT